MTPVYAKDTEVSVAKSKQEIEQVLTKFGCERFAVFVEPSRAGIVFERSGLRFRVMLGLTTLADHRKNASGATMSAVQQQQAFDKECRRRWRAMFLVIKAKLVAVEEGISTLEEEFLSSAVLPDGGTVGERVIPEIHEVVRTGQLPPMVPGLPSARVIALGDGRRKA